MDRKIDITTPTLLLDEEKCRRNIERMAAKAKKHRLRFRPHFKTHQSQEIGRWFRDYGVEAITVSSLMMADYFADDGWRDITVAFPVNIREHQHINTLASRVKLQLLAESITSLKVLEDTLQSPVGIFIKIDTGYHRTGLGPGQVSVLNQMLEFMDRSKKLSFKGFLSHAGHTYRMRSVDGIRRIHRQTLEAMQQLKARYAHRFPDLVLSIGDTPSCSTMDEFEDIDEIRPGNFVFYDLMQVQIGSCSPDLIAIALACPVVALHPERSEIVLYGGGVHLSKDRSTLPDGQEFYGYIADWTENGWQLPENPSFLR